LKARAGRKRGAYITDQRMKLTEAHEWLRQHRGPEAMITPADLANRADVTWPTASRYLKSLEHPAPAPAPDHPDMGTPTGYRRHRRQKEKPCRACRLAYRTVRRAARARNAAGITRQLAPHGTVTAYYRHRSRGEEACDACREAVREDSARKRRERGAPIAKSAEHGTVSGYTRHRSHGEEACDDCKRAWREYNGDRRRKAPKTGVCTTCGEPIRGDGQCRSCYNKSLRRDMEHGTTKGYGRHRRAGEPACKACLKAWSDYTREAAKRHRERLATAAAQ
jgi:hypothetical protein